ncbi:MAG: type II toxin-antitoxin system VapC family toxin [Tannerella sp.]|jgi:predicted nucleic acid-binding protein|nr:type II toxin-antitoxin system VapC family toxin [Tannerella sp.]
MATKYSLQTISQLRNRAVFADANVLIYLFWPTGSLRWESDYAAVYSLLLKQATNLYIDFIVVSEVINQMLRIEHRTSRWAPSPFKRFRDSPDGQSVLSDIYLIVENQILNQFKVIGNAFSQTDILHFLTVDSLDFPDKGIVKICQNNHFVLLTNDRDFRNVDVDILTCNPAI